MGVGGGQFHFSRSHGKFENAGAPVDDVTIRCSSIVSLRAAWPNLAHGQGIPFECPELPAEQFPLSLHMEYTDSYRQRGGLEYEIDANNPVPGMKESFAYQRGVLAGMGQGA